MNLSVVRQNRINDLFKYALKLAQNNTETYDSIKKKVQFKAETLASKSIAREYTDAVFARIEDLKEQ
jgi:hypothetical protein